jgi:PAS domain S-box-containing protein
MSKPLRLLLVEDSEMDGLLMTTWLKRGGFELTTKRVYTAEDFERVLMSEEWDVVISDYNMPKFDALSALRIFQGKSLDIPFIIVSGGIGEETAVAAMRAGAHDYVMKDNLHRLAPAVERELREAAVRGARRRAETALRESEERYRGLWETAPDAVLLMDERGVIRFANPAAVRIFGFGVEEFSDRAFLSLFPEHCADQPRAALAAAVQVGTGPAGPPIVESVCRHANESEFPVELWVNRVTLSGIPWLVAFVRDVSELRRARAQLHENEEQFRVAREIQQKLFPKAAPQLPGFELAGVSLPADAIGGDYFDYIPLLRERWGITVGDVTGHGLGPSLLMAETRACLRVLAQTHEDVSGILNQANRMLSNDVGEERFVTLLLASIDPATRKLVHGNAGHPAGVVLDAGGGVKAELKRSGPPLGRAAGSTYAQTPELALASGDVLLLMSDGIEETMSPAEEWFGVARARDVVSANRHRPAREIVNALISAVRDFANTTVQLDDLTVIVVKVL